MKLITKRIPREGESGEIDFHVDSDEDIWHLYNLIRSGDVLKGYAFRKVSHDTGARSVTQRIPMRLDIAVTDVHWSADPISLRAKGTVSNESEFVHRGQFHTYEISNGSHFRLFKSSWEAYDAERVRAASDPAAEASVAAVIVEPGLAHVCVVSPTRTIVKARLEQAMPRKRPNGVSGYDKAEQRFYTGLVEAIHTHIPFSSFKVVLIAGPGAAPQATLAELLRVAELKKWSGVLEEKNKIKTLYAASGHKIALSQVLQSPEAKAVVVSTGAAGEAVTWEKFLTTLNDDADRAFYGFDHVERCVRAGAVSTLLITDALFRSRELAERQKFAALRAALPPGSDVEIFSTENPTGEQLEMLTGLAVICRFPMPHIDDPEFDAIYGPQVIGARVTARQEGEEEAEAAARAAAGDDDEGSATDGEKKNKKDKKDKKEKKDRAEKRDKKHHDE